MKDDESIIKRLSALLVREEEMVNSVLHALYGDMPKWMPTPSIRRAERIIQKLLQDGFSEDGIRQRVEEAENDDLIFPGTVTDPGAFAQTIYELAHLRYAVSLGKLEGLRVLAGKIAEHGEKFNKGGRGAGPIRKAIAKLLAQKPTMKNPELWEAIKKKPPRGWCVEEPKYFRELRPQIVGPNPETDHMGERRFYTVCGQERGKLKGKITG